MDRPITGFKKDDDGDWMAILGCGHPQHVRHNPPFTSRAWVTTCRGRNGMLGKMLNCVRCDRSELPEDFVPYKKTPVFTENSIPAGLRKDHSTRAGVWGKIIVMAGKLRYRADALAVDTELTESDIGVVVPEVPHQVEPLGAVRFFVEFYRAPDIAA